MGGNFWTIFVIVTLIAWFISPVMMYVVGIIGESRLLPIWKNQFRGFIPGDFLLGLGLGWLVATITTAVGSDVSDLFAYGPLLALPLLNIVLLRLYLPGEIKLYGEDAVMSPVKRYHDFFVIPVLFDLLVGALYANIMGQANLVLGALGLLPIMAWVGLNVYDGKRGRHYKAHKAHKSITSPIWRARRVDWNSSR